MGAFISFWMGFLIATAVWIFLFTAEIASPYAPEINACEANLPRTQHCVLVAVPESEVE